MISQLNRIDIAVTDVARATQDYADLFGFAAGASDADGARFRLANTDVRLHRAGAGETGLSCMAFGVDSLERAARRLDNCGLAYSRETGPDGARLRLAPGASLGTPVTLEAAPARDTRREAGPGLAGAGAIVGVDHLVLRSTDPVRAMAFWGAQLGLSLRFDRSFPQMGARVTLFRCGDMKIEVASRQDGQQELWKNTTDQAGQKPAPSAGATPALAADDELWGVSWRAGDITSLYARLAPLFEVSELRNGLEPETSVFTIRNRTHGVATIAIGAPDRRAMRQAQGKLKA